MLHTLDQFEISTAQESYLQDQLNKVSRSFALVIPFVENPLRNYLAASYLLCRVVDNIEDGLHSPLEKEKRFAEFSELLQAPQRAAEVLSLWGKKDWAGLTDFEERIMGVQEGRMLWEIYAAIPSDERAVIRHWVSVMAEGMRQLNNPTTRPYLINRRGIQVLETKVDYDAYCYFVAGTVGHLATELVVQHYSIPNEIAAVLRAGAEACGRSLQKTNIIKDFVEDLERGICYLPDAWLREADLAPLALQGASLEWTAMVLNDVLEELRDATDYLLALPYHAAGYRRASLLCLLPAYETIHLAAKNAAILFTPAHQFKISRLTMARCLADSEAMLFDNSAIDAYSRRQTKAIQNDLLARVSLQA